MSPPIFLDVFSGIGGFTLGLERAGWYCVGHVETDPFCTKVLERHWPHVRNHGDVRTFSPPAIGSVDLVCAGWPCQDHSVAGRRAGLAGARSGLFRELVRLVRELRPRWLLLENVPGLLSSRGGRDFAFVLAALGDAGYGVGWRVLDARWFGVPQRRRRVFLVGRLGAPCPPEVLFEPEGVPGHSPPGREAGADVAGSLAGVSPGGGWRVGADEAAARQLVAEPAVARSLTAHGGSHGRLDGDTDTFVASHHVSPPLRAEGHDVSEDGRGRRAFAFYNTDGSHGVGNNDDVAPPLKVASSLEREDAPPASVAVAFAWQQGDDSPHTGTGRGRSWIARAGDYTGSLSTTRQDAVAFTCKDAGQDAGAHAPAIATVPVDLQNTRLGDGETIGTLDTTRPARGGGQAVMGAAVRRLTPTECERLMAFPPGWTCLCGVEPYSTWACRCPDGPRYGALGNAVVVNVVEWLGRRLLEAHTGPIPPYQARNELPGERRPAGTGPA